MITLSDLRDGFWLAGFLLLISLLIFLLAYGVARVWYKSASAVARDRGLILAGFLGGLPLGFTGMVAGFLTGSSRSPAVSALVPAILTFIGLIVIYLSGRAACERLLQGSPYLYFPSIFWLGVFSEPHRASGTRSFLKASSFRN